MSTWYDNGTTWTNLATLATDNGPALGTLIWEDGFDTAPNGVLNTQAKGNAIFAPTAAQTTDTTYNNGSIVDDPAGGKLLRHTIPIGEFGKFIVSPVPSVITEHAVMEYEMRFDANFDWRWGGKVGPGFVGWAPGYGPYDPTGGSPAGRDIGFSTRLMWHGRDDNGTRPFQGALGPIPAERENELVTYIYARHPREGFGGYGWHTRLNEVSPNVWHKIRMEVKLNTVGLLDGEFKISMDDQLMFSATDWDYRMRDDIKIQAILWNVFRGGSDTPGWMSQQEDYIDIRNVAVRDLEGV